MEVSESVLDRLEKFITYKEMTVRGFGDSVGLSNGTLGAAFSGGRGMRSDNVEKILQTYPELSAEWLMRGTGSMIIGEGIPTEQIFKTLNLPANSDKIIAIWMKFMECTQGMQELYRQADFRPEQNA